MATIPYSPIEGELWKPIPGCDNRYEASSEGRIRVVRGKFCKGGRIYLLHTYTTKDGYVRTALMRDGKSVKVSIHTLVALAFLGPCPDGLEVDHVDRDKNNNKPYNLEYTTHKENLRRAYASGGWNTARGERSGTAKLTDAAVRSIRSDARPQRVVAAEYGISQVSVCLIRQRKSWKHVAD